MPKAKQARRKVRRKESHTTNTSTETQEKNAFKKTVRLEDLAWKPVRPPSGMIYGDDDLGGFLGLEEVEGVECIVEGDESVGRVYRFEASIEKVMYMYDIDVSG
jgi:hypothetical protein